MHLQMPHRKSRRQRMVKELPKTVRSRVSHPPKAVKGGAAAVGGVVGIALGSAAVSSLRRRPGNPQS
jgi:hypothetical protein